jgi:hypothetical protein
MVLSVRAAMRLTAGAGWQMRENDDAIRDLADILPPGLVSVALVDAAPLDHCTPCLCVHCTPFFVSLPPAGD